MRAEIKILLVDSQASRLSGSLEEIINMSSSEKKYDVLGIGNPRSFKEMVREIERVLFRHGRDR